MAYSQLPTRTSADPNAASDINQLQDNVSEARRSRFYQIDGDFNGNQSGSISQSANGYDVFDMWQFQLSGATGTFERTSHASTNSKPYYATIDITGADNFAGIRQNLKGNILSGKSISYFFKMKYTTNKPSSLRIVVETDGSGDQSSTSISTSSLTTSFAWFRVDVDYSAYSVTNYSAIRLDNPNNQIWDLDIDKIRIIETHDLDTDIIPEWVKEDEDSREMHLNVFQYYNLHNDSKGRLSFDGSNAPYIIEYPLEMVQEPTLTLTTTAGATVSEQGGSYSGNASSRINSSGASDFTYEADARY